MEAIMSQNSRTNNYCNKLNFFVNYSKNIFPSSIIKKIYPGIGTCIKFKQVTILFQMYINVTINIAT